MLYQDLQCKNLKQAGMHMEIKFNKQASEVLILKCPVFQCAVICNKTIAADDGELFETLHPWLAMNILNGRLIM